MQQDDPGDSVLALSPSFHSPLKQRKGWSDLSLVIADAIRLHVIAATPEQAADAAQEALQRLEDAGFELRRR
jgi:alkanesulfonate monooxygenase SsuD/methylene tetrahydromethanopterin reductase-like flavin-dependent oxidoreductase (luciferase family)